MKLVLCDRENEIANYRRQGNDKVQMFGGDRVPRLVAEIQKNANRFRKMPVGPLGAEIELAQVWSLSSFKVSCQLLTNDLHQDSSLVRFLAHNFLNGLRQQKAF